MISYALAAERAQSAMYTVEVTVPCAECGAPVRCIVAGTDLHRYTPSCQCEHCADDLGADAVAMGQQERDAYAAMMREGEDA